MYSRAIILSLFASIALTAPVSENSSEPQIVDDSGLVQPDNGGQAPINDYFFENTTTDSDCLETDEFTTMSTDSASTDTASEYMPTTDTDPSVLTDIAPDVKTSETASSTTDVQETLTDEDCLETDVFDSMTIETGYDVLTDSAPDGTTTETAFSTTDAQETLTEEDCLETDDFETMTTEYITTDAQATITTDVDPITATYVSESSTETETDADTVFVNGEFSTAGSISNTFLGMLFAVFFI